MKFESDAEALQIIKKNFQIVCGGLIEPRNPDHRDKETKEEMEAINYLCSEFDYAYM